MLDGKQVKGLGLQFARALQIAIKTAAVFPIEHKSSERPIQQSFEFLNNVLKAAGQFTFGFIDKEVMLNKVLTSDPSLRPLETEFTKRGIAAITFEPGIGSTAYRKLIYLFAAPSVQVEAAGGFLPYIEQNPLDGLRVVAAKKPNKDEQGDTIIESDSEAYILARQRGEHKTSDDFLESIEALLESGCFDPASRAEALANLAAGSMEGGYGVPLDIPKISVVKDGEAVLPATNGPVPTESADVPSADTEKGTGAGSGAGRGPGLGAGSGMSAAASASGSEMGGTATGTGGLEGGTSQFGNGQGATGSVAVGPGGHAATAAAPAPLRATGPGTGSATPRTSGGRGTAPDTFLNLIEQSIQRSLAEETGNPEKSLLSLARLLGNTGVDRILERFPPERLEQLSRLKPEQLAAEYMEETALQLAGSKLKSAAGPNQIAVEEEVLQVLSRTLQATHMADRLAAKLTKFLQDFAVPPHIQEKIREELQWTTYPLSKKFARIMEPPRYSNFEFRRFMEVAKELLSQRDMDRLAALVNHYFQLMDDPEAKVESTDLSRAPEIVQTLSAAYAGYASKTSERLIGVLQRRDLSEFVHFQAANGLSALGQCLAAKEEFQQLMLIGLPLEKSYNQDRERHSKCCGSALGSLVPPASVGRVLDNHLQKRADSGSGKTAATLLRFAAPASIQDVMERLVNESDARNRLALVRLAGQLGTASIEVAVKYLSDERWYVVRNMCGVLAELRDPHLAEHIVPALRHSDARVQQAALKALTKAQGAKTAQVLADSLTAFAPQVLDEALDQLMYLRSASTIAALEDFAASTRGNMVRATKAIQALGAISDPAALYALGRLFRIEELDPAVRRAALAAISGQNAPAATQLLQELSTSWGPLAEEAKKQLAKRQPK